MADFNNLALTFRGVKALLEAQAGKTLTLSKIGMGSGSTTSSIIELTGMAAPEIMLPISEKIVDSESGYITIVAKMTNEDVAKGFYWRETGLFFEDSEGNDVLFAYACVVDDQYDYVPAYSDNRYVKHIRIANIVTDSADITVKENGGLLYVDTLTFEEYKEVIEKRLSDVEDSMVPIIDASSNAYNMDSILKTEHALTVYKTNASTIGTPYAKGVTDQTNATIFSESSGAYGYQFAYVYGERVPFMRTISNGVVSDWTTGFLPLTGGFLSGNIAFLNYDAYYAIQKARTLTNGDTHWLTMGVGSSGSAAIEHYTGDGTTDYTKATQDARLELNSMVADLANALILRNSQSNTLYKVYGQHNKASLASDMFANNLTTTAAGYALDARQGKALKDSKQEKITTTSVSGNSVKAANGVETVIASITLSAGTYLVLGSAYIYGWDITGSGERKICISTSTAFDNTSAGCAHATEDQATSVNCWKVVTLTASTTLYLLGYQATGLTQDIKDGRMFAMKIA